MGRDREYQESARPDTNLDAEGAPPSGAGAARPSEAQRRYLERGLTEPGGKLPLFDRNGGQVPRKTIEACIAHGWAEPWTTNPIRPDWLVCRLTAEGYRVLGHEPPAGTAEGKTVRRR